MKLIGSLTSPYVRKVRVVLAEKKLDYNFVLEDVWGSDAILAANPLGKVPVLVMEGAEAVFDSRVIVEYVDTLSPVGKLIPASGRGRGEAVWTPRPEAQRCQPWIDRQQVRIAAALKSISQGLGDKPYCVGTHFSLADIAVGCALGYLDFRSPENTWRTDYPNIVRLADKLAARQSFIDTAPPAA